MNNCDQAREQWELVGSGSLRDCYALPNDPFKVIKFARESKEVQPQNRIEAAYYAYLEKRRVSYEHITKCYGWAQTEKGEGLIFDRAINEDLTPAITLKEALKYMSGGGGGVSPC